MSILTVTVRFLFTVTSLNKRKGNCLVGRKDATHRYIRQSVIFLCPDFAVVLDSEND